MAIGEQILKTWLRQKYTDNNSLKTTFGSGTSLTVPDTSNSSALATDINTLVTSLRAMQTNTYLRYSPLWSSVNINNVSASDIIANTKKDSIDNLVTDLLAMCVNYSKTPTEYSRNDSNATAFSFNSANVSTFGFNSANVRSFGNNTRASSFNEFTNLVFTFNSANLTGNDQFSANMNVCSQNHRASTFGFNSARVSAFTRNTRASAFSNNTSNFSQTCSRFSQNSSNRSGLLNTRNTQRSDFSNNSKNTNASGFSNNTSNASSFSQNSGNGTAFTNNVLAVNFAQTRSFFSQNTDKTPSTTFFRYSQAAGFSQDTLASSFTQNTFATAFTQNSTNASSFSQDTRFSQRFVYSFIVKSDRSTTTHSNIGT